MRGAWWEKLRRQIKNRLGKEACLQELVCLGACLLSLLALACTLYFAVLPAVTRCAELRQEESEATEHLQELREFAAKYADYDLYRAQQQEKLAQERQNALPADANQAQLALRNLAVAQGLKVRELSLTEQGENGTKLAQEASKGAMQNALGTKLRRGCIKAELGGDYFAFLRWLEAAEARYFAVERMEMQAGKNGEVRVNLLLLAFYH